MIQHFGALGSLVEMSSYGYNGRKKIESHPHIVKHTSEPDADGRFHWVYNNLNDHVHAFRSFGEEPKFETSENTRRVLGGKYPKRNKTINTLSQKQSPNFFETTG